jgi:hypothetical protein
MGHWRMAIAAVQWRMAKAHCKTCRCFVRLKRHVCKICRTRKLEKFMRETGTRGAFGKPQWACKNVVHCAGNPNYGAGGRLGRTASRSS